MAARSMSRACLVAACLSVATSFTISRNALPTLRRRAQTAAPAMIISPEAMVSIQKFSNKAKFEETVEAYAKQKRLSIREAELEYAKYLIDPDGFVLESMADSKFSAKSKQQAAPKNVKPAEMGQRRSPLLQAYIDEGGAEVEERITKFERENTIKACAIIAALFGYLIYQGP